VSVWGEFSTEYADDSAGLFCFPPWLSRAVSFSKFDRAGKPTGRDFWLLNSPQRKLGINYY